MTDSSANTADDSITAGHEPETGEAAHEREPEYEEAWVEEDMSGPSSRDRMLTALFGLLMAGWIGFFIWARRESLTAATAPSDWVSSLFELMVPVLLLALLWQALMRTGRAQQRRFADTARTLAEESSALEQRLTVINRELSLARDFIASQSRDLESLGRVATERLSGSAETLQALISTNGDKVDRIGVVSDSAVANMERLRDQLPVLANSARDMTNQIGSVGNAADRQLESLVTAMKQLEEHGAAGEAHVEKITARVAETLAEFELQSSELGSTALSTFAEINRQSADFQRQIVERDREALTETEARAEKLVTFLDERNAKLIEIEERSIAKIRERVNTLSNECDTILAHMRESREQAGQELGEMIEAMEVRLSDAIERVSATDEGAIANARTRLAALADEAARMDASLAQGITSFEAELAQRQEESNRREREALAALENRLAQFDEQIGNRQEAHLAHVEQLAQRGESLAARLAAIDTDIASLGARFSETNADIASSIEQLEGRLHASRQTLDDNSRAVDDLTGESVRLLELLQAGKIHAEGELSGAIVSAQERLTGFHGHAERLAALLKDAEQRGAVVAGHVETAKTDGNGAVDVLQKLEAQLAEVAERSKALAEQTRGELQDAIAALTASSQAAVESLRTDQNEAIREVADTIARDSNAVIAEALGREAQSTIAELESSAQRASEISRQSARELRNQLAAVNELTGNLEQRVATAREKAEERVDHDFTRRMAAITEALNSSAIDISRAFEDEVADTQWAQYLRGDRGIFTRRAVRLLDKQEARSVHAIYVDDSEFRETVNRYIHDFEAMLRNVLSTRDGNAVAVTLLSSDVGKLYVMLAQAIDRLRD
ncbi:hypothetical protein [Aurantiacibacter suaedae]|uniref:hypothetical protein n=1 Tax=Aurantiacibacter suaedae TaxID=2545755 RepID=UPI0010F9F8E9|nr:hypothetical protein [Aurantiacibacter suaedae]